MSIDKVICCYHSENIHWQNLIHCRIWQRQTGGRHSLDMKTDTMGREKVILVILEKKMVGTQHPRLAKNLER